MSSRIGRAERAGRLLAAGRGADKRQPFIVSCKLPRARLGLRAGGLTMFKRLIFFAGCIASAAAGQDPQPAGQSTDPAALFGARARIEQIDLSPDGRRVLYLTPGPRAGTMVVLQELGATEARVILRTDGDPERLESCNFVADDRVICSISLLQRRGNYLIPFSRLLSIDASGGDPKLLGERESFFDAYIRQFDGAIIDWRPGQPGTVLMSRSF